MGLLLKMAVIMMSITAVLWIAMPTETCGSGSNPLTFLAVNYNGTCSNVSSGSITTSSNLSDSVNANSSGVVTYGTFGFISDYARVMQAVTFLMQIFYAPAYFMMITQAPIELQLLVTGIWTVMYIIGIISFIRGKDA